MLVETALAMPYERTRNEALKIALFQLTEEGGGARKRAPRYRSRGAYEDPAAKAQHEHVIERRWLRAALIGHPRRVDAILDLAVACLVLKAEHEDLRHLAPEAFGWRRYLEAEIEVLDAADDFKPVDLERLAEEQITRRDALGGTEAMGSPQTLSEADRRLVAAWEADVARRFDG